LRLMKNRINSTQIVEKTLELINRKGGSNNVNLREIARELKCHHTNIYNYFDSFDAVLWSSVDEALGRMILYVNADKEQTAGEDKIERFFSRFTRFYLENKGWFRLIWFDSLQGGRPEKTLQAMIRVANIMTDVVRNFYSDRITMNEAHYIIHTVHCFLHGEVSIFISGRGIFKDEEVFIRYTSGECAKMLELLAESVKKTGLQENYPRNYEE
jgi:AcrR family transcriptional regulator